jgi:integrase
MKRVQNLQKRANGVYYMRKTVGGKVVYQSLGTSDKDVAKGRLTDALALVEGEKWADLKKLRAKPAYCTIRQIIDVWEAKARVMNRTEIHARNCSRQLLNVLRASGADERSLATVLTQAAANAFRNKLMGDTDDPERTARTVRSSLTQARSMFCKWAMAEYTEAGLALPDLAGFRLGGSVAASANVYTLPELRAPGVRPDLREATLKAAEALRLENPRLWVAFVLCHYFALRAREAANAQWSWLRQSDRSILIQRTSGFRAKSKRARAIPVCEDIWDSLLATRGHGDYILPADTPTGRHNIVGRELADWMRSLGWSNPPFGHAAHELRAWMGCRWFTERSPAVAQLLLGHQSIAVTCASYATFAAQPAPVGLEAIVPAGSAGPAAETPARSRPAARPTARP